MSETSLPPVVEDLIDLYEQCDGVAGTLKNPRVSERDTHRLSRKVLEIHGLNPNDKQVLGIARGVRVITQPSTNGRDGEFALNEIILMKETGLYSPGEIEAEATELSLASPPPGSEFTRKDEHHAWSSAHVDGRALCDLADFLLSKI